LGTKVPISIEHSQDEKVNVDKQVNESFALLVQISKKVNERLPIESAVSLSSSPISKGIGNSMFGGNLPIDNGIERNMRLTP